MLKAVWSFFFLSAFAAALWQSAGGVLTVWNEMAAALFSSAKASFTIALNLTGMLCLWLGLLKIAEKSGSLAETVVCADYAGCSGRFSGHRLDGYEYCRQRFRTGQCRDSGRVKGNGAASGGQSAQGSRV